MTDKQLTEVSEGNRIIAEFLGWEFDIKPDDFGGELLAYNDGTLRFRGEKPSYLNQFLSTGLNYHQDWNKLMPVVEKIEKIKGVNFNIVRASAEILLYGKLIAEYYCDSKIEAIWNAIVAFIKNQNKQS